MKERPILFSAPMVRALLAGTKTQTRRAVALPRSRDSFVLEDRGAGWWPYQSDDGESPLCDDGMEHPYTCPYGRPGDRLWVRETFARIDGQTHPWIETDYRATYTHGDRLGDSLGIKKRWSPAIHMPRHASRILLDIKAVRVERLQDISEADAAAEGLLYNTDHMGHWSGTGERWYSTAREAFRDLWQSINGPDSWGANPWVWVVEFERAQTQKGPAS
ncbi:hypothetical protein [Delftia sp. PS-11]|uniref:hypothetical protein n=1 Tax=Delftia sp. PS-11 TaxID=2767222 RepID=UPI00245560F1|nr:hypothetical protein [Delftia sp. PS-11]KAJ8745402.1 hypothetical protein H9T68_06270 [Delftia sp. PS-11]